MARNIELDSAVEVAETPSVAAAADSEAAEAPLTDTDGY